MIGKKDIIHAVRRITKKQSGAREYRIMHPERDWAIGLSIAGALFLLSVGYSGYTFLAHLKQTEQEVSVESSIAQYDQEAVAEVLERYGARTEQFKTLRLSSGNQSPLPSGHATTSDAVDTSEKNIEPPPAVPEDDQDAEGDRPTGTPTPAF